MSIHDDVMYKISCRLNITRHQLRRWNRVDVGDIFRRLEEVEVSISDLQTRKDTEEGLSADDLAILKAKFALHHNLLKQQEALWRQKSRVQWC